MTQHQPAAAPSDQVPPPVEESAFQITRRGDTEVLTFPVLDDLGVDAVVTTRTGGVSTGPYAGLNLGFHVGDDPAAVLENRARALAALVPEPAVVPVMAGGPAADGSGDPAARHAAEARPPALDDAVFCIQNHGRAVHVATTSDRGRGARDHDGAVRDTDALVTTETGLVLAVMVADCVPILLVDPHARVLATVHAGWRGTFARVTDAAIAAMAALGASPERVVAAVGPAVAPARYEVGPEVADAAATCFGTSPELLAEGPEAVLAPSAGGRWLVDLWTANERLLRAAGVPTHSVHTARVPTGGDGPFFSDRDARPCGRFALLARLRD